MVKPQLHENRFSTLRRAEMIVDVGKGSVHEVDGYHGDAGWDHKYGILADAVAKGNDHEYRANSEDDTPE